MLRVPESFNTIFQASFLTTKLKAQQQILKGDFVHKNLTGENGCFKDFWYTKINLTLI